jgi:hypothetical protein
MNSIRNFASPLRKTDLDYDKMSSFNKNKMHTNKTNENANDANVSSPSMQQTKRLLKADKKLLNNLTSSDDVRLYYVLTFYS